MLDELHFVVRTPHAVVVDAPLRSARVPTDTGQVGLRPREEPIVLAIEPGLILLHGAALRFVASAGGLLQAERASAVLYTPFAVISEREDEVLAALDRALSAPDSELAARRKLDELEHRIVEELRHAPRVPRARSRDDQA